MFKPYLIRITLFSWIVFLLLSTSLSFAQEAKKVFPVMQAISTPDFGYLPTFVARAKGFFIQEGLDLKILIVSVRVSVPALLSREVHFAVAGSSMPAALRGAPLKAIFFTYKTSTFQLVARPEITGPQSLKGKAVALSTPGSSNDQATRLILKKMGLEPGRDVSLIASGDSKARVLAMETGKAGASAVNPDVAAYLALKGYNLLMNSADVYPVPFSGMAAHDDLIRENPELIKKWLRAQVRAMLYIRKNPEDAAQVAAKELKLAPEIALGATKLLVPVISSDDPGGFTEKGMRLSLEYSASRLGVDANQFAISQVADLALLREVQREMGVHCREGYQCK
ncbi:MAG: ABC transporter substrate-binding protein [Deltaproteobacteria bacterium]|nr:ABC transporter substrate-binding protein [Deltaproteobacteria bacterium]